MKYVIAAAMLAAGAAQAQEAPVTFENCAVIEVYIGAAVECAITNRSDTAVASAQYHVLITQPNRTVPWVDSRDDSPAWKTVRGGIEPGETVALSLRSDSVSDRADMDKIEVEVILVEAFDVNDEPID